MAQEEEFRIKGAAERRASQESHELHEDQPKAAAEKNPHDAAEQAEEVSLLPPLKARSHECHRRYRVITSSAQTLRTAQASALPLSKATAARRSRAPRKCIEMIYSFLAY